MMTVRREYDAMAARSASKGKPQEDRMNYLAKDIDVPMSHNILRKRKGLVFLNYFCKSTDSSLLRRSMPNSR
jgi:hypothetical protein